MHVVNQASGIVRSTALLARRALILVAILMIATSATAASPDPQLLPRIQTATFEVVAAKPVDESIRFEKPLPLDLLPYQQRTDKYFSIGTAFHIGNGRYVTAGHVLMTGIGSLWGPPELRDANGNVFPIDKIEKFSLGQDFAVFSVAGNPGAPALEVNTRPVLNDVVYAVGNALGTGVVIRDGLYTSDTPEQQDGRWKWMRFSAAASPGNSGGPLLDTDGKVIGVVMMKSANENLNYALPIHHVLDAPDNLAVLDQRLSYQFDVFAATLSGDFKAQFELPLSLAEFNRVYGKLFDAYCDRQLKALLASEAARLFPNGDGSHQILHDSTAMKNFPNLITRDANGIWSLSGESQATTTLPDNGYIEAGMVGQNILFHLRKPDSVGAGQLYGEPARLIDLLAKVGFLKRQVGPESILITSLGEPTTDVAHVDRWQRRWQVRVWPMAHENALVTTFSLPVPDGYITLMRITAASAAHDCMINLQALTDFFHVTYDGTLAQWKDFLEHAPLPAAFKDIDIGFDYDKQFRYTSDRLRFSYTPALQEIHPDSMLTLGFSFFPDGEGAVWDVGDVWAAASPHDNDWINFRRNIPPSPDLNDSFKDSWDRILHRKRPYDAVAFADGDVTKINSVVDSGRPGSASVLYTAYYFAGGKHEQADMKAKLDLLLKDASVLEH
jgi:S1-C subfamily serine protease